MSMEEGLGRRLLHERETLIGTQPIKACVLCGLCILGNDR